MEDYATDYATKTSHQLLLLVCPDFDEKLKTAPKELRDRIMAIAMTDDGFRPLHYLQGCL